MISSKVSKEKLRALIKTLFFKSSWVGGLQRLVKLRRKAPPGVMSWCSKIISEDNINVQFENSPVSLMINMILKINDVYTSDKDNSGIYDDFYNHVHYNLIHEDKNGTSTNPIILIYNSINVYIFYVTYNVINGSI